jgi:hypothetical protein
MGEKVSGIKGASQKLCDVFLLLMIFL